MVRMEWDCRLCTGLPPPQQPTPSVVKPEGRPAASMKPGQESCVRSIGIITLSARGPSDQFGTRSASDKARLRRGHSDQSRRGHQCRETSLTGESQFHISTPLEIWTRVPCDGKQTGSPLDQWDMVGMEWDRRLSTQQRFLYLCYENTRKKTGSFTYDYSTGLRNRLAQLILCTVLYEK